MIRFDHVALERSGRVVLDEVSLDVEAGEALAFVGPSGAGKTSLLAALATALPVCGGDILVDGRRVRSEADAVRRLIGYVPSHLESWPGVRADEFLELFAAAAGLRGKPLRTAIGAALAMAGMESRGGDRIDRLSDGDSKRLLIARALVHAPRLLILDDPLGGLDPAGRSGVERLVEEAILMGRCVVAAIDDGCVPECFTRLAVLGGGRLLLEGPANPAHYAATGRIWRYRITCRGRAEAAADAIRPLVHSAQAMTATTVDCAVDPARVPFSAVIAAVVGAGIAVESAGFHPPWTAQLVDSAVS